MARQVHPTGNSLYNMRLIGSRSIWTFSTEKNLLLLPGIEHRIVQSIPFSLSTTDYLTGPGMNYLRHEKNGKIECNDGNF